VNVDRELNTIVVNSLLKSLETIKVAEIRGLIGRITKQLLEKKVVYLMGD
jgi:hypothetical protein